MTSFRIQYLAPREGEKLRRQLLASLGGATRRRGILPDLADVGGILDEVEAVRDHREQIVEVVRDTAGELTDRLHLLALVELLLDQPARLHRMLVIGDVAEKDRKTLAGGKRIDGVPDLSTRAEHFEECRPLRRRHLQDLVGDIEVVGVRKCFRQRQAPDILAFRKVCPGGSVEIGEAPVLIDDQHAVGGALEDHRDPGRGFLRFLPRVGQFLLAVFQRIGHGVECIGDPRDFGSAMDVDPPGKIAEPPSVGSVDQLPKRATDEPTGAQGCQDQHQRGTEDDQEDAALRAVLDCGECLVLVQAEADEEAPGTIREGCIADDPLHAVQLSGVGRTRFLEVWFMPFAQGPPDKVRVVGIAGKIPPIAIHDSERSSRRSALSRNVVGEPIQAEGCDDGAPHLPVLFVEGQRKLDGL